jgi:putative transposase
MVNYRRVKVASGSYFFTITLQNRQSSYLIDNVDFLREVFKEVKSQYPIYIRAIVILPEHLHTIWTLPPKDTNYSTRWQLLKSLFTRKLVKNGVNLIKNAKGEYNLWQRRYWEHAIRDETDMQRHIDYIHYNPVKHGMVNNVKDWPYSSFHRYVEMGVLEPDWGANFNEGVWQGYGE